MTHRMSKHLKDSIRYTLAYSAGNVALSSHCPMRLKENLTFLRDYIRRGLARDALGCMVENIFMGDVNDCRYAAVIRWYERRHPGTRDLIVSCLDELADYSQATQTVSRIRRRLHVPLPAGKGKKPSNRLKRIVGV